MVSFEEDILDRAAQPLGNSEPFVLSAAGFSFAPTYYPETFRMRKQRNLDRSQGFCQGEDVSDLGSKNREYNVTGRLRGYDEVQAFNELIDSGSVYDMTYTMRKDQVYVKEGELEGPVALDGDGSFQYQYTLDLVSTGVSEPENSGNQVETSLDAVGQAQDELTDEFPLL